MKKKDKNTKSVTAPLSRLESKGAKKVEREGKGGKVMRRI